VIQVKHGESEGFLYETTCDTSNDVLVRELVEVWNTRLRLWQLAEGVRSLAKHGPMKKADKQGIDSIAEKGGDNVERGEYYCEDPTGVRTGNGVGPQLTETLERVAQDAENAIAKDMMIRKVAVKLDVLKEKLDNMRGAVMMAYPMGLPEWDTVKLTIDDISGLEGTAAGESALEPDTAELWIASRMLDRHQKVSDRFGKNEKTKVIAKLQKPGAGAPGREAVVSEEEKKAMMAFYFKKQEEMKRLAENDEDDYLASSWADPKALQSSLRGMGSIRAPGL